jgi:hypothetical protein
MLNSVDMFLAALNLGDLGGMRLGSLALLLRR